MKPIYLDYQSTGNYQSEIEISLSENSILSDLLANIIEYSATSGTILVNGD